MPARRPTFKRRPKRQPDLFLSHSSTDKAFVRELANDLSGLGIDVWFDEWEIEIGDSLHKSIGRGLARSRYVAVIISAKSASSDWCEEELDTVMSIEKEQKRKRVLPLLYEQTDLPVFLKGRVCQDLREAAYWPGLTLLAGLLHGFSKQGLANALARTTPTDLKAVAAILVSLGWSGRFYVDENLYEQHRQQILRFCGKRLEDLRLDEEYYGLIADMQKQGVRIAPIQWPPP